MYKVLIATDFSKAARNATLYGLQLAKEINARIILFNAFNIPTPATGLNVGISRFSVWTQIDQKIKTEAETFRYLNMPSMETLCDEGNPVKAIRNVAKKNEVDFIVIGMKGSGKNFRKIFGSTATSLAKQTKIPVIIIPESAIFLTLKNIAFANDAVINSDKEVPKNLKKIIDLFKSKLKVVKVVEDKHTEVLRTFNNADDLKKNIYSFDTAFEYPASTDVRDALNTFIKKHHCDMLVMMPHKHDFIERLFKKSETEDMIFHTSIPLLVLPEVSTKHLQAEKLVTQ
ncbi:MAG: universal stress protein [Ginsengibacter sp.]